MAPPRSRTGPCGAATASRTVAMGLDYDHHLDLSLVWPHLWLTLPDPTPTEVISAEQALTRATTLGGWALLYAPLAAWWWPAVPLSAVPSMPVLISNALVGARLPAWREETGSRPEGRTTGAGILGDLQVGKHVKGRPGA